MAIITGINNKMNIFDQKKNSLGKQKRRNIGS